MEVNSNFQIQFLYTDIPVKYKQYILKNVQFIIFVCRRSGFPHLSIVNLIKNITHADF